MNNPPFDLLADPTRRRILHELLRNECAVGTLVKRLRISQPAVSKQLRLLREAGLANFRIDGQRRLYRLNPEGLKAIDRWLAPFRAAWTREPNNLEPDNREPDHREPASDSEPADWDARKGWRSGRARFSG